MNRFDKPLSAASTILIIIAMVGMSVNLVAGIATNNRTHLTIFWFALLSFAGSILLFVSEAVYRKWHTHTSVVTGIWTERRPREHKLGRSFQDLTTVYPEVAIMKLKSGGTYILGTLDDSESQALSVQVGDTVVVKRAWDRDRDYWSTQLMGVISADVMSPAKKASA